MCRNIKTLANFEPPATDAEIRASALQFVRKLSGTARPSRVNEAVFQAAVEEVTAVAQRLIRSLKTSAAPRTVVTTSALILLSRAVRVAACARHLYRNHPADSSASATATPETD